MSRRPFRAPVWLLVLTLSIHAKCMAQSISFTLFTPPAVNSSPEGLAAGPDGAMWFAEFGASKIGRVTTAGAITEYALPAVSSGPYQITAGSDGAMWFTEFQNSSHQIGRITTGGAITEYALPNNLGVSPQALGITAGPDGALWFTSPNTSQIGQITTAGQIAMYSLPASANPSSIAAGPDGALWFLENSTPSAVGRITTAGAITQYPLPSASAGTLTVITAGPDGALWFIDSLPTGATIARITTTGAMTSFAVPAALSGLAAGPDGALWFSAGTLALGRITTSGSVTSYTCDGMVVATAVSGACYPNQLALGPNGAVWFSDLTRAFIGEATPGGLTLTSISPTSAAVGGADFTLTVNGGGFANGAIVDWNGSALATTYTNGALLTAAVPGSADLLAAGNVTVTVVNPGGAISNALTFTVNSASVAALAVTTAPTLPLGVIGAVYSQSLGASGGAPPYTWSLASGSLPSGLLLSTDGTITGTPTQAGTSTFTARLTDSASNTASPTFSLTIYPSQAFGTSALRIPQIVDGGGWNTRLAIVNLEPGPVSYTFQFWDDNGNALALPILNGAPGIVSGTLAPGGAYFAQTAGTSSTLLQGWAEVASTGRVGVMAMFQYIASGSHGSESSAIAAPSGNNIFMPFDNTQGHATAVALANTNPSQPLTISLQFQTDAGVQSTASIVLPPRGHTAFVVPLAYPAVANQRGSINFTASSADIAVMGLREAPTVIGAVSLLGAFQ